EGLSLCQAVLSLRGSRQKPPPGAWRRIGMGLTFVVLVISEMPPCVGDDVRLRLPSVTCSTLRHIAICNPFGQPLNFKNRHQLLQMHHRLRLQLLDRGVIRQLPGLLRIRIAIDHHSLVAAIRRLYAGQAPHNRIKVLMPESLGVAAYASFVSRSTYAAGITV